MSDVINFFFTIQGQLWQLIISNWILSISVLIAVIGWVISIVNTTKGSQG